MKQVIQNYRNGKLELMEVPVPVCHSGKVLVKTKASLISLGTERSIIELGKKSLLGKAKARPDLVKRFTEKVRKEGFFKTFNEALDRLDTPTPLGYSSAGVVIEVGSNVHRFSPGDKVACIGAGYASHAEYITIPEHLCCKIPDGLTFDEASFGMLGIIALHGIRCAKITFGESVVIIGLGLLGLLTVQILNAYGSKVIGMDIDEKKTELAKRLGAAHVFSSKESLKNGVGRITAGNGADAVIITASTKSSHPVHNAVDISRYRGRIVLVGVADMHPDRNEMWHKEVEIVVSKAGGPGTFDPIYENKGIDYPIGYVRWTENRNLEEFLRLIAEKKVSVESLMSHKFKITQVESVYKNMLDNKDGPYIGVILEYTEDNIKSNKYMISSPKTLSICNRSKVYKDTSDSDLSVGVIGAGLFGRSLLLPALKGTKGVRLEAMATASGANAFHTAKKFDFKTCTTDYRELLENPAINSVIILTPHSLHAQMVIESIKSGKHVFVEKPLCVNEKELEKIIKTFTEKLEHDSLILLVGYNRRFSPHLSKVKDYLANRNDPLMINYRVNSGFVSSDHWVHAEEEGGSRIIGEVCHFVDAIQYLTGNDLIRVYAERISGNNRTTLNSDNVAITLKFSDGSVGNILYSASGDRAFSRERIEIFCEGVSIVVDDFRRTDFYQSGKKIKFKTFNQQMGYKEELQHFVDLIHRKKKALLSAEECFKSTHAVFCINQSLEKRSPVKLTI